MTSPSLREKVAREIADHIAVDREPIDVALAAADAILALPEIREALEDAVSAYENGYAAGFAAAELEG